MSLAPQSIDTVKGPPGLKITWSDGQSGVVSFIDLRKACPCALCKGEKAPLDFNPNQLPVARPIPPEGTIAKNLFPVGTYAIGFQWGDGHNEGIYTWEYLREVMDELAALSQA